MADPGRNYNKCRLSLPNEQVHELPVRGGSLACIIQHDFHHSLHAGEIIRLFFMVMPCLYNAGLCRRQVYLAKLLEQWIITPQDFHKPTPLLRNDLQVPDDNTIDGFFYVQLLRVVIISIFQIFPCLYFKKNLISQSQDSSA